MDNPEGQVTYPDKQDGRATFRLWHAPKCTRCVFIFAIYNHASRQDYLLWVFDYEVL